MAEEVHYASGADPTTPTNKRKYDDPPSSGTRRPTGFSAPIASSPPESVHAPPSYNAVQSPADDIQLAKQRAQEIAARLFNSVDPKRSRVENGVGGGFESSYTTDQKPFFSNSQVGSVPSARPVLYGFQDANKTINIPNERVGIMIGKGGETIKYLQLQSGAKIQITRDSDADLNSSTRLVELKGTTEQIAKAEQLIKDVLSEAESGGSGVVSRRLTGQTGSEQFVMKIPNNKVGLIIGKGGETIKTMQANSGARIQVIPLHLPQGDPSTERTLQIDGTTEQIESAKQLVNEVISENRLRSSAIGGGYQQQGYQAQPPTNWPNPPPPPMQQQPGYGFMQPGAYPSPSPQYNMSQPTYAGYPQQQSGGYSSSGWDQTTAPPSQQTTPGSGYNYYGQQQLQGHNGPVPADNSGNNYNQPPASIYPQGQGYAQDGYSGGYHAPAPQTGYGQPNPVPGYDQQQGYNSAPGYGNMTNPSQDEHTTSYGTQGENAQQPSSNPGSYSSQGATQQGYGMTPSSQAGYGNQPPAQPGCGQPQAQNSPASQPAYGQPTPSTQGTYVQSAPGYPPSQPPAGYGAPPYGMPPYMQPYGQPGYSAVGDIGSASQAAQQGTVAKASPQN